MVMDLRDSGPFFILLVLLASHPVSRCELTGVDIQGDEDDQIYIKRNENDTCGEAVYIKNENTFDVPVNIAIDGYTSQELTVPAEEVVHIQLNSSFVHETSTISVLVSSENGSVFKNLSILQYEVLNGLQIDYEDEVYIGEVSVITASVTSGTGITFEIFLQDNFNNADITAVHYVTEKIVNVSFSSQLQGNYTIKTKATSICGETDSKTVLIFVKQGEEHVTDNPEPPENFTLCLERSETYNMEMTNTSDKPFCVKDQGENQNSITEIHIDLTSSGNSGYAVVSNESTEVIMNLTSQIKFETSRDSQPILMIVLSCFENTDFQESQWISIDSIKIVYNKDQTFDNIIFFKNNYPLEIYLEMSKDTDYYSKSIPPGGYETLNLGDSYDDETYFGFKMNTRDGTLFKNLSMIYKERLWGLEVDNSDVVEAGKDYDITATVLSGSDVKINFMMLSSFDEYALRDNTELENVTTNNRRQVLFSPSFQSNYEILVSAESLCQENITRIIEISAIYPDFILCPERSAIYNMEMTNTSDKPFCVKDQGDNQASITEIHIDLTSLSDSGFAVVSNESTDVIMNIISQIEYETSRDSQPLLLIVLSCFEDTNPQGSQWISFDNINLVYNANQTLDNIIFFKNNYPLEIFFETSRDTDYYNKSITPGSYEAINLGESLDDETYFGFKMNARNGTLFKNVSLINKERLWGLEVDYSDVVEVGKDYNITATVLSGSDVKINFMILSSFDQNALKENTELENVTTNNRRQVLFSPGGIPSNYTILVNAESLLCEENITRIIEISALYPEICQRNENVSNVHISFIDQQLSNTPTCIEDWYANETAAIEFQININSETNFGFVSVNYNNIELLKNWTSQLEYQEAVGNEAVIMIVLSCFENVDFQEYESIFNDRVYILHNSIHTFNTVVYVQNNYPLNVLFKLSNDSGSQTKLILPGGIESIDLGNSYVYDAETKLSFTVESRDGILSKNLSLIIQEPLSGLEVDYSDAVVIGEKYNITATIFSGSNVNIDFSILSPDDAAALTEATNARHTVNGKSSQIFFNPSIETNYTILVSAESLCEANLTTYIVISAVYPAMCPRSNNNSLLNTTGFNTNSSNFSEEPVCTKDWSGFDNITVINFDVTSDSNRGNVFVSSNITEPVKNILSQSQCQRPSDVPNVVVIILTCEENFLVETEANTGFQTFQDIIFMLHDNSTCERVFYFENNYLAEVRLKLSDGVNTSQDVIIKPKNYSLVRLATPVLYGFTNFTFTLKTLKEAHVTNLKLKYEALQDFEIQYEPQVLIDEEMFITASISSGSQINFTFMITSPDNNATSSSYLEEMKSINNLNSQAKFKASEEFNFTIQVQATSACGESLSEDIVVSVVYPDLCLSNETTTNLYNAMKDTLPSCIMDLSEENETVTQIHFDLASQEIASYKIINNSSLLMLNDSLQTFKCQDTSNIGNMLLYNIILSCPELSLDGFASTEEYGDTIYILQKIKNICGHGFYVTNNYYNDTELKILNGTISDPLHGQFITESIQDELLLTFNLNYHKKLYSRNISLKFHEVMFDLHFEYEPQTLVGLSCNIKAQVATGVNISFDFQIKSGINNETLSNSLFRQTKTEDKTVVLSFTPDFVGSYFVTVTATSFCKETLNRTIQFDSQLCLNNISTTPLAVTKHLNETSDSPTCIMSWGDIPDITEFNLDLQMKGAIGYKYSILSTIIPIYTLSPLCPGEPVVFSIVLTCFSTYESNAASNESYWFNRDIYIKRELNHSCDEYAVVYNNYTVNVTVYYTYLSVNSELVISPKSLAQILLNSSFSSGTITFSFMMPFVETPYIKNISLIHFDVLHGLDVTYVSDVEVNTIWNVTAKIDSGLNVTFTLIISAPSAYSNTTKTNNYTINYVTDKEANIFFTPKYEGNYNITVIATSMCGEALYKTVSIFAYYRIQKSIVDAEFEITNHRKEPGVFYPKDIVGIALKVMEPVGNKTRPTLPNCTINWGQNSSDILEKYVDLTPNSTTGYIYVRSYNYTSLGQFTVSVLCLNAISQVAGNRTFTIVSPVDHADVVLLKNLVPYNTKASCGVGTVQLIQNYIFTDYSDLIITLDFGELSSKSSVTFLKGKFIYSYNYPKKGNFIIDAVIEAFGINKTYSFPIHVGYLLNFQQENRRWLIRLWEPTTFNLVRYSPNGTMYVSFEMGEVIQNKTFENGETAMKITVTYNSEAVREAKAIIVFENVTEIESYPFESFIPCISTLDFFDVSYRTTLKPLKAWLTALPTISGRAERTIQCNYLDVFTMKWQVWRQVKDAPSPEWTLENFTLPHTTIVQNFNFIKSVGLYKIQLQISVERKNETELDFMYMLVTYPPLAVKIKYGSFRQAKYGQIVTLDAKSETKELAGIVAMNNKYEYAWECYILKSKNEIYKYTQLLSSSVSFENLTKCNLTMQSEGVINISTSSFTQKDLALFYVKANNTDTFGGYPGYAGQVVEILDKDPVEVIINCVWNCMEKLVPGARTVFEAKLLRADEASIKSALYIWTVLKYIEDEQKNIDIANIKYNNSIFDTDGEFWEEGATYSILVNVTMDNTFVLNAIRTVVTNFKPYGGNCSVNPSEGNATDTTFLFNFLGWKDEGVNKVQNSSKDTNFGLQYEVHQETSAGTQLIYAGNEVSASTYLTECKKLENNQCQIFIYIFDMFRGVASCNLTVKVQVAEQVSDRVSSIFFSDLDKKMNSSIMIGDPIKIVQRAASLSALISSMGSYDSLPIPSNTTTTSSPLISQQERITRSNSYVETVTDAVQKNVNGTPGQIQIFANSMAIVTTGTELTTKSMETASGALYSLTYSLSNKVVELSSLLPCLEGLHKVVNNIIKIQNVESQKMYASLNIKSDGYTQNQIQELLEIEENKFKTREQTKLIQFDHIVENVSSSWDNVFKVVARMSNSDGKYEAKMDKYTMAMQKTFISDAVNTSVLNDIGLTFDNISGTDNSAYDKQIQVKVVRTVNIYTHGLNAKHINRDIFIGSAQQDSGNKLNLTSPTVSHELPGTNCTFEPSEQVVPQLIPDDASQMFYHKLEYKETFLHFCLRIQPSNPFLLFKLYLRMDLEPTDLAFDHSLMLTWENFTDCKGICFEPGLFTKPGTIYIGLHPILEANETANQVSGRQKREAINTGLEAPYHFRISSGACFGWDDSKKDWFTNKCKLSFLAGRVACTCDSGMEVVNGMSFNVFPNTIHFASVFSKFDIKGQGLILGVLLFLYVLFTVMALWAHYMDKKSMFQWGVFPLADNYADDHYFYLITVHTGLRKSAGTTSNVSFNLSGELDDTGFRKLSDGVKKGFPTASVYHFVMACSGSLGELQCLKIWHDSTGKGSGATWYLDRVDVIDLQTGKVFYFMCGEWLAPECGVEKIVEASNIEDLENMNNLFMTNTKEHITDDHMWISLFIRPQRSNFSRVERAVCCLAFLLLSMITSAMFYKNVPGVDRTQKKADFELGIIRLSYEQLYHSFVSAVITAIPMIFVMMVFRKARLYKKKQESCDRNKIEDSDFSKNKKSDIQYNEKKRNEKASFRLPWMVKLESQLEVLEKLLLIRPTNNSQGTWPHQLRYMAWVILFLAIITSSFFIVLYSMEWGKDVTESWISTFFLTFLESLFIIDPIKVIVMSVVVSLLLRKAKAKQVDHLDLEFIAQVNQQYGVKEKCSQLDKFNGPLPLSKTELKAATLKRKIHIMINSLVKDFCIHFVYLLIVASLCHVQPRHEVYQMHNVIVQQVISSSKVNFLNISSASDLFNWIPRNFTPWIFPENDKLTDLTDQKFYTKVKDLYLLGTPRIRQLRTKKENCQTQRIKLKECVPEYGFTMEEKGAFCPGWKNECISDNSDFSNAWIYTEAQDIWGLPIAGEYGIYGGGGYIASLRFNETAHQIVANLKNEMWIDRQTRAVFIEFTLYSPNINYFVFVILLAEFLETGGIVPYYSIYPFTVHYPSGLLGTYLKLCQIVGIIFTLIGLLYVIFMFSKKRWLAFKDFWFLLDAIAVLTGIATIAMMFLRLKFTTMVLSKLKEDRSQFVNMYHIVVWDAAYNLCLAILIAIGCFRLLQLASYSEVTMKVYLVLKKSLSILPNFCIFIFLILLSFIFFGWLTFGTTSIYFKNFWSSSETMFTGILGRSSFKDTNSPVSDRWMNITFFCLFVGVVVIFLTNFFLAVLMNLLSQFEEKTIKGENTKVLIVLWDKFMRMMGSKRDPLDRLREQNEKEDKLSKSEEDGGVASFDKTLTQFEQRLDK